MGIRGGFGTLSFGRQSTTYKMKGLALDPFYDTASLGSRGTPPANGDLAGATFGASDLTNGWADRGLVYASPAVRGVTVNGGACLDADGDHDLAVGGAWRGGGAEVGVQHHRVRGASAERVEPNDGKAQSFLYVAGSGRVAGTLTAAASVEWVGSGWVQAVDGAVCNAGLAYDLDGDTRVYAIVSRLWLGGAADGGNVSLGIVRGFRIGP